MAKVYRVIGKPAGAPVDLLHDRAINDEFQAELDNDFERTLIDSGALEIVKHSVKVESRETTAGQSPKDLKGEAK